MPAVRVGQGSARIDLEGLSHTGQGASLSTPAPPARSEYEAHPPRRPEPPGARALGATVTQTYTTLGGYVAEPSPWQLAELRANPQVAYVEADQEVSLSSTQTNPTWGLGRVDQREQYPWGV